MLMPKIAYARKGKVKGGYDEDNDADNNAYNNANVDANSGGTTSSIWTTRTAEGRIRIKPITPPITSININNVDSDINIPLIWRREGVKSKPEQRNPNSDFKLFNSAPLMLMQIMLCEGKVKVKVHGEYDSDTDNNQ